MFKFLKSLFKRTKTYSMDDVPPLPATAVPAFLQPKADGVELIILDGTVYLVKGDKRLATIICMKTAHAQLIKEALQCGLPSVAKRLSN